MNPRLIYQSSDFVIPNQFSFNRNKRRHPQTVEAADLENGARGTGVSTEGILTGHKLLRRSYDACP